MQEVIVNVDHFYSGRAWCCGCASAVFHIDICGSGDGV